ncbi:gamma-glutamyl-gamma-aminobutyrate hydrolase family protein [Xanthomonas massiliensis]|jgi:putative glutamine amidotransferase|uniref:gamma-glutamyl-gamma-aminobutyrate hydrolase family protein n=1 Tax=Xanthomonas massiliensis TaxID=1720302 RepID=UPI0008260B31|nr:gamma-glutamyl-gamma-aminobutyrate hydrolase family protein [Xanthomonas massiliensis]
MSLFPLVGLPTDRIVRDQHPWLTTGEEYVRAAVDAAGVAPVLLPVMKPPIPVREWLQRLDGLLLTGAESNIEPYHYGDEDIWEDNPHDPARDASTLELIPEAVAMGLPVLAICRGFQEVNVALGGSLHQRVHELPGMLDHREDPRAPIAVQYAPAHEVALAPGGLLADIAGTTRYRVNSLHGQGVKELASGLVVEAVAPDGLIEAFHRAGPGFLLAVQWHPEWGALHGDPFNRGIFQAFGQACRLYASNRHKR